MLREVAARQTLTRSDVSELILTQTGPLGIAVDSFNLTEQQLATHELQLPQQNAPVVVPQELTPQLSAATQLDLHEVALPQPSEDTNVALSPVVTPTGNDFSTRSTSNTTVVPFLFLALF